MGKLQPGCGESLPTLQGLSMDGYNYTCMHALPNPPCWCAIPNLGSTMMWGSKMEPSRLRQPTRPQNHVNRNHMQNHMPGWPALATPAKALQPTKRTAGP